MSVKRSTDDILYAFILDKDGEVLSHTFSGGFPIQLKNRKTVIMAKSEALQNCSRPERI